MQLIVLFLPVRPAFSETDAISLNVTGAYAMIGIIESAHISVCVLYVVLDCHDIVFSALLELYINYAM